MATVVQAFAAKAVDGVSTAYQLTGDRTIIEWQADSIEDGSQIVVQVCSENTSAKFSTAAVLTTRGSRPALIILEVGWWVRVKQVNSGSVTSNNVSITH